MNKILLPALLVLLTVCRVSFGATNPPSPQQISCQCKVYTSDKPIPHDVSRLAGAGVDVVSCPNFTCLADRQSVVTIGKELNPVCVRGMSFKENPSAGVSVSLKGTPDHHAIRLRGKLRLTQPIGRSSTPQRTTLATISKDLWFSAIVGNGKEAWFDVESTGMSPGYLSLLVVPTIVNAKP